VPERTNPLPSTYYSAILHFHNAICSWLFPISAFPAIDSLTHYYSQHKTFSDKKPSRIRPYIMAVLILDILVAVMTLWWLFEICTKKISNLHSIINFTISKSDEAQQNVKNYPSAQLVCLQYFQQPFNSLNLYTAGGYPYFGEQLVVDFPQLDGFERTLLLLLRLTQPSTKDDRPNSQTTFQFQIFSRKMTPMIRKS
jgi:hypothetical protein